MESDVAGRHVALLSSLDRPDAKLLPLLFAADTLRELYARKIGLVAPVWPICTRMFASIPEKP
nr:hypothetical protein [Sphingomonas sp. AP4-R1]